MPLKPHTLLLESATEGARNLALELLKRCATQAYRLKKTPTPEAMHDFRVAMRRLRTHLQSYRQYLGKAASDEILKGLKKVSKATTSARDLDVEIKWITKELKKSRRRAYDQAVASLKDYFSVYEKIKKRLEKRRNCSDEELFSTALDEVVAKRHAKLEKKLRIIEAAEDIEKIHKARIAAKKYRYVLEPVAAIEPRGRKRILRLKDIQTTLGNIHDMHVLKSKLKELIDHRLKSLFHKIPRSTKLK